MNEFSTPFFQRCKKETEACSLLCGFCCFPSAKPFNKEWFTRPHRPRRYVCYMNMYLFLYLKVEPYEVACIPYDLTS